MLNFVLSKTDYKKLLIILKNNYVISKNEDALNLYSDLKMQGGL